MIWRNILRENGTFKDVRSYFFNTKNKFTNVI